jgi:hypothetical protein
VVHIDIEPWMKFSAGWSLDDLWRSEISQIDGGIGGSQWEAMSSNFEIRVSSLARSSVCSPSLVLSWMRWTRRGPQLFQTRESIAGLFFLLVEKGMKLIKNPSLHCLQNVWFSIIHCRYLLIFVDPRHSWRDQKVEPCLWTAAPP